MRRRSSASPAPGALVAETIAHVGEHIAPGVTTRELDDIADAFIREHGGVPDLQGIQGLSARDLHLRERRRRARHPGPAARSQDGDLVTIDVGVTLDGVDRRQRLHLRASARSTSERSDCSTRARTRSGRGSSRRGRATASATSRTPSRSGGRGRRLLGRAQPRRSRRRPPLPRGPARAELRPAGPRPAAGRGHDDRHRADDHGRQPRRRSCTRTAGRSPPSTARCRPTSSTRWRSPATARACSRRVSASPSTSARARARPAPTPTSPLGRRLTDSCRAGTARHRLLDCAVPRRGRLPWRVSVHDDRDHRSGAGRTGVGAA